MTKQEIESVLQTIPDLHPTAYDSPSPSDWQALEARLGAALPSDFKYFIELMSKYSFPGDIYNVSQMPDSKTNGNDTILDVYESECNFGNWPIHLLPFYGIGNGDYFVLDMREQEESVVYYKSQADGTVTRHAQSFSVWIEKLPNFLSGLD